MHIYRIVATIVFLYLFRETDNKVLIHDDSFLKPNLLSSCWNTPAGPSTRILCENTYLFMYTFS